MEFETERCDFLPKDVGQRHHRRVAAALEFERNGNEWIDVPQRPDIRQNYAQFRLPGAGMNSSFESNAWEPQIAALRSLLGTGGRSVCARRGLALQFRAKIWPIRALLQQRAEICQ